MSGGDSGAGRAGAADPAGARRAGLPASVLILGERWAIEQAHGTSLRPLGEVQVLGVMAAHDRTITVDVDVAPAARAETLCHELVHALLERAGLRSELGNDTDEKVAERLTPLLLHTLRENPEVLAYLLAGGDAGVGGEPQAGEGLRSGEG